MSDSELVRVDGSAVEIDWLRLLQGDVSKFSDDEQVVALSLLDAAQKAFEDRTSAIKQRLRAETKPEPGTTETIERAGVKITIRQNPAPVTVNEVALLALLERKQLTPERVCFRQVLLLEPARLEQAIAGEVFSPEEVAQFTSEGKQPAATVQVRSYAMGVTARKLLGQP